LRLAIGTSSKPIPNDTGSAAARQSRRSTAAELCAVVICTVSVPDELTITDRLDGLNRHAAYSGRLPHWNVNVLAPPPLGVSVSV
jgi:hypothetical protein